LVQFVGWFTGVTADLGPYSPGANDNASAVGSVLALAERLQQQPLQHTEVWLVFTGCEETGGDGLLHLLEVHGAELKEALFLDFELVGIGDRLVYLEREGLLHQRRIPPAVLERVQAVAEQQPIQAAGTAHLGVFTENAILWERGYQSLCLMLQRPETDLLPEWHRLTDVPSQLQPGALDLAHNFAWELIRQYDVK
jgi:putative aminopeptidase FrvX